MCAIVRRDTAEYSHWQLSQPSRTYGHGARPLNNTPELCFGCLAHPNFTHGEPINVTNRLW